MVARKVQPKSLFHARIHAEKRWDDYVAFREALRHALAGKVADQDLWRIVSFKFPPLDGSEHEVPMTRGLLELVRGTGSEDILRQLHCELPLLPLKIPRPQVEEDYDFWLDGDLQEPPPSPPETPLPSITPQPIIKPPPLPVDDTGWTIYARNTKLNAEQQAKRKINEDEVWAKLAYAVDRKKRCPILETAEWIYHNLGTPVELIDPAEVPSAGALDHLRSCKENPATKADFYKTWMVKTIPDKKQMDFEAKRSLGSMKVFRNMEAFEEQFFEDEVPHAA